MDINCDVVTALAYEIDRKNKLEGDARVFFRKDEITIHIRLNGSNQVLQIDCKTALGEKDFYRLVEFLKHYKEERI